jgi:hypothetical protein
VDLQAAEVFPAKGGMVLVSYDALIDSVRCKVRESGGVKLLEALVEKMQKLSRTLQKRSSGSGKTVAEGTSKRGVGSVGSSKPGWVVKVHPGLVSKLLEAMDENKNKDSSTRQEASKIHSRLCQYLKWASSATAASTTEEPNGNSRTSNENEREQDELPVVQLLDPREITFLKRQWQASRERAKGHWGARAIWITEQLGKMHCGRLRHFVVVRDESACAMDLADDGVQDVRTTDLSWLDEQGNAGGQSEETVVSWRSSGTGWRRKRKGASANRGGEQEEGGGDDGEKKEEGQEQEQEAEGEEERAGWVSANVSGRGRAIANLSKQPAKSCLKETSSDTAKAPGGAKGGIGGGMRGGSESGSTSAEEGEEQELVDVHHNNHSGSKSMSMSTPPRPLAKGAARKRARPPKSEGKVRRPTPPPEERLVPPKKRRLDLEAEGGEDGREDGGGEGGGDGGEEGEEDGREDGGGGGGGWRGGWEG